jgi:hypothetical protein
MSKFYKVYIPDDGYEDEKEEVLGYYNTEEEAISCVKSFRSENYMEYNNLTYDEINTKDFNVEIYDPFYCFYDNYYVSIYNNKKGYDENLGSHIFFTNKQLEFNQNLQIEIEPYQNPIGIRNVKIKLPIVPNNKFQLSSEDYLIIKNELDNHLGFIFETYKEYYNKNEKEIKYYPEKHCHILNKILFNIDPPKHDFKIGDIIKFNPESQGISCKYGIIKNIEDYNVIECVRYKNGGLFGSNLKLDAKYLLNASKNEFELYLINKECGKY